jgi:hypothetical protein
MARRDREINIFNIAFLDVITGAMGAFVLLVVMLSTYVNRAQQDTQIQQVQQAEQDADEARKERDQLQQKLDQQTQQTAKEALDRAEKNIEQADQAMQTDDVEELKRLLAQARADLAEARQQLDQLNQELQQTQQELQQTQQELKQAEAEDEALQQRLNQAKAEVEDLKKKLDAANQQRDQALASAEQARQQVAGMQDALDHSEQSPSSWALIEVMALPNCGNVDFEADDGAILTQSKHLSGFTDAKDRNDYLTRSHDAKMINPVANNGQLYHRQWFVPLPDGLKVLFGVKPRAAASDVCRVKYNYSYSSLDGDNVNMRTDSGGVAAISGTQPTLLVSLPPGPQGGAPTPEDVGLWQKMHSGQPSGAAK